MKITAKKVPISLLTHLQGMTIMLGSAVHRRHQQKKAVGSRLVFLTVPGRFQLQKKSSLKCYVIWCLRKLPTHQMSRALPQITWRGHWLFSPSNPGFESQWFLILSIALRAKNQMCLHRVSEPKNSSNNLGKTILTTMAILSIVILLNLLDLKTTHFCFYWYFISKIYWTSIKIVGCDV